MIKRLRRKFVLIVMIVVTLILLGIFFTMLLTTQKNNERMSINMLRQAFNMKPFSDSEKLQTDNRPPLPEGQAPNMRLPVLVVEIDQDGTVSVISNQLHFLEEGDIVPITELALNKEETRGILSGYELRYLRESTEHSTKIAFADISIEGEMLRTQTVNSLLIGGLAMLVFFLLSLFLSHWAVRPVEAAWEQQKQFIANASHELKTPLTVILSNAHILRTENAPEGDKNIRRIEHIHAEAVRMKELVEDMLTLMESDSTDKTKVYSMVDFSYLVKSTVLMYEPMIYDEGKKLLYEIEDGIHVKGDMHGLEQVAHILLDNARKYSSSGGAIHVSLKKAEHKHLLLQVSNEGALIPKEELEHIFLRFYRQDESRSGNGSFGLGLSIAQSIVTGHKGSIWAESDEKRGNTFYVSLPFTVF